MQYPFKLINERSTRNSSINHNILELKCNMEIHNAVMGHPACLTVHLRELVAVSGILGGRTGDG